MGWNIEVREKVYQCLANEIFFRILHLIYVESDSCFSVFLIGDDFRRCPDVHYAGGKTGR